MGGSSTRPCTVKQLRDSLVGLPDDAPVMAYCGMSEDVDGVRPAKLYATPQEADDAHYYQGDGPSTHLGTLQAVEPGTGKYGRERDRIWVPYEGPVVLI